MELKLNIEYNKLLELINQLPKHLREQLKADLKDTSANTSINTKEKLAALIKEMRAKPMFTDIKDPVEWQRNLRNEWG